MDRAETGRRGEAAAAKLYCKRGCELLAHNFHSRFGEVDLIVREPDGTLVFCEVKTRGVRRIARPAEAVNASKRRKLVLTVQFYLQKTDQSEAPVRFDVAEVTPLDGGRWAVHIIKGAFTCQ